MILKHVRSFVAVALSAGALAPAEAHHSFAAVYDGSKTVTLEGIVTEFRFVNPHALATIDVSDDKGAKQQWTVEFPGRLNLTNAGWNENTIAPGEHVRISGSPERTGGPRIYFSKLVHADGRELVRPALDRNNTIDEERRQRALQRDTTPESGK